MSPAHVAPLQAMLDEGVSTGVFPTARAHIWVDGHVAFEGGAGSAGEAAIYDLASLTKVMHTTACFLALWGEGLLSPSTPLRRFFPGTPADEAGVTLGDLLYHRSGLPAWQPFFVGALERWPMLLQSNCDKHIREEARSAVVDAVLGEPPQAQVGQRAVYSDLGFIILGEVLTMVTGQSTQALFESRVRNRLGLGACFRPLTEFQSAEGILPTGHVRPRPPAPGQLHRWARLPTVPSRAGEVDDDNCWVMDGLAGHAGLFGTAQDVARFGQACLEELNGAGRIAPAVLWEKAVRADRSIPGSTRGMGFDTPSPQGSSAGRYVGLLPPGAFGHVGFTGVSLWVDRARKLVVALCTNRTAEGRADVRIQSFRPRFHDLAVELLAR
ncbi:MAG: serine hydrolase domain-containing protein [Myxococcaceae bacterium]